MPTRLNENENVFKPKDNTPEDNDLLSGDSIVEALLPSDGEPADTLTPAVQQLDDKIEQLSSGFIPLPPNETPPWATDDLQTATFLKNKLQHTIINDNEYQAKGDHGSILWRTDPGRGLRVYVNGYASSRLTQKDVYHLATGLGIGMNK